MAKTQISDLRRSEILRIEAAVMEIAERIAPDVEEDTGLMPGKKEGTLIMTLQFPKISLDNVERIRKEFAKPYKHKWTRVLFGNIDFILRYYLHIKR